VDHESHVAGRSRIPFGINYNEQLEPECSEWGFHMAVCGHSLWNAIRIIAKPEVLELQSDYWTSNEYDDNRLRITDTEHGLGICIGRCRR